MATIKTPVAGVSPYQGAAAAEPTALTTTVNGRPSTVSASTIVNGQEALNSLITSSRTGVFQGANVTINLEEQNFSTTNQVTSNTNYPAGNTGEIQFNSGANSFSSDPYFTYTSSNVVTPGIRTDGYFYSNGAPFIGGGNAAIGNFVFTGDTMTIAHANSTLSVTGNGTGNINVSANSKTWIFDADGNLTLPANSFAVNYANGNPVVISGAGANLPLANGTSNINIATANGNVTVTANGNTWTFDTGGNLIFPSGLYIADEGANTRIIQNTGLLRMTAGNTAYLKVGWEENIAPGTGNVALLIANGTDTKYPGNVAIRVGNEAAPSIYSWVFDASGNLTLPTSNSSDISYISTSGNSIAIQAYGAGGNANFEMTSLGLALPEAQGIGNGAGRILSNGIILHANANSAVGPDWIFDTSGNLTFPTGMKIEDEGANTRISQLEGSLKITSGGNATYVSGWSEFQIPNTGNAALMVAYGNDSPNVGQVVIKTGAQSSFNLWTFAADGNLTLPANSFAVNYANGNPVVISGGASSLPLANGTSNINIATANGNVTITANGSPTWTFNSDGNLTLPTAGNIVGAVNIIGNGAGNVNVEANGRAWTFAADGNLVLPLAGNIVNYGNTWNFGYDGILTLPGNSRVAPVGANIEIQAAAGGYAEIVTSDGNNYVSVTSSGAQIVTSGIYTWTFDNVGNLTIPNNITAANVISANVFSASGNIIANNLSATNLVVNSITSDDSTLVTIEDGLNIITGVISATESMLLTAGANTWTFNADGNTVFPTLSVQRGDNPSGTITGQTLLFGDYTQEAIISTPDGKEFGYSNSQRLVINPGAGAANSSGEGGDIYLWAGRGGNASGTGGDIKIRGGQGGDNSAGGAGGAGGYILMEAGDSAGSGYPGYIELLGGTGGTGQPGGYIRILGGQGPIAGGDANITGGTGSGTGIGGNVNIIGGVSGNGLGDYGNVNILAGASTWTFDNTGNLTLPGSLVLAPNTIITGYGASPAPSINGFDTISAITLSASGNVTANNISLTGNGFVSFTSGSTLTFGDTPVTNRYYVDATRTSETYVRNGSQARPFNTIAAAQSAIATAIAGGLNPEVEPVYIILLSNITENVTLATNHVYLVGQNGQIHQPIILTGNVTVQPTSGTLNNNHFSISGIEVVGGTDGKAIYVTGTFPTRLSLQDMWITANGNSGAGLYQDNSGTGTYTHGGPIKVSHNGVGDVYCFDIRAGTASFESVETSGATQVGAAGPGATLTFNNSQLDANGNVVVETYGNGVVVVTNSVLKNSAANSSGIRLNAVANVAGTASVGQSAFNIPLGTGKAVWLDPNTTPGLSGVFAWSGASFYPSTNTTIDPLVIPGPLAILVGTQVSPIFYGDITSYAVAQDWDLIDNNASALSFDTTGKTGVLELVTTNSAEGVKMSGFASAAGNVTGGNALTGGLISATGNVTGGNILTGGLISATANITGGNLSVTGNITGNTAGFTIGYLNVPQVSFSGNATIAATDAGKHYYSTLSTANVLTIANNTSVSWAVGTAISLVNRGTGNITVAQGTGVSLYLAGNATAGNRTVATYGMATLLNVAANVWMINGTGVS